MPPSRVYRLLKLRQAGKHAGGQAGGSKGQSEREKAGREGQPECEEGKAVLRKVEQRVGGWEGLLRGVATAYNPPPVGSRRRANGMIAG